MRYCNITTSTKHSDATIQHYVCTISILIKWYSTVPAQQGVGMSQRSTVLSQHSFCCWNRELSHHCATLLWRKKALWYHCSVFQYHNTALWWHSSVCLHSREMWCCSVACYGKIEHSGGTTQCSCNIIKHDNVIVEHHDGTMEHMAWNKLLCWYNGGLSY